MAPCIRRCQLDRIGSSGSRESTSPTRPCVGNAPYAATITRLPSAVAAANATAILSTGFAAGVPPALVGELVQKNLRRTGVDYGPVLVAVLAR